MEISTTSLPISVLKVCAMLNLLSCHSTPEPLVVSVGPLVVSVSVGPLVVSSDPVASSVVTVAASVVVVAAGAVYLEKKKKCKYYRHNVE